MSVAETIEQKLRASFHITSLNVVDDSYKHAGHSGAPDGGESHFQLAIVSPDFTGKSRVARQRDIYRALKVEMAGPIHALSIDARSPEE